MTKTDPTGIWVRATVHLPKLPRDHVAYVNPADPEVISALRATWLVPLPGQDWQERSEDATASPLQGSPPG